MPRLKQAQVLISNAYVIERARQVESEIVSGLSHFRNMVRGCEARIAYGEDFGENILLLFLRDHVKPDAKNVGMLAVMFLGRRVGDQIITILPAQPADSIYRARLSFPVLLRTKRVSEGRFQLRAITERFNVLERDDRRSAVCILGRHSEAEVFSPVDERPPSYVSEESVWSLPVEKPIQHGSRAGYLRFNEFLVPSIEPEIMNHADPQ